MLDGILALRIGFAGEFLRDRYGLVTLAHTVLAGVASVNQALYHNSNVVVIVQYYNVKRSCSFRLSPHREVSHVQIRVSTS